MGESGRRWETSLGRNLTEIAYSFDGKMQRHRETMDDEHRGKLESHPTWEEHADSGWQRPKHGCFSANDPFARKGVSQLPERIEAKDLYHMCGVDQHLGDLVRNPQRRSWREPGARPWILVLPA